MSNTILQNLQIVFREVFNNTTLIITPLSSAKDIPLWDSLMHITLIASIESKFKISFSFNEVMQFNNVGDIIQVIDQRLKR